MEFWMRSATVQLGPSQYNLEGMHFSFSVPFEDSDELSTADIEIKNLSESTRRGLQKGHPVIINAGYQGDIGQIFEGEIANISHKWQGTEWITKVQAIELLTPWTTSQVNKTYKRDMKASEIIPDLSGIFGAEVAQLDLVYDPSYPRGLVCAGATKDILRNIVENDCGSQFMTRNGKLYIFDPATGIENGFLLSPATGLLRCDEDMEMTPIATDLTQDQTPEEKKEGGALKRRQCLLNHKIGPGDLVMFQSKTLNGRFQIIRGKHEGSATGNWITEIEVKAV